MARNAAGRRQDTSDPLLLNLNWNAPFVGSGTNACGVQPPIVCISNHYVLGNDVRPQDAVHDSVRLQRSARSSDRATAFEIGYLGSRSKRLERMFDANEVTPGPGQRPGRGGPIRSSPRFRRSATSPKRSTTRWPLKLTRRLNDGFSALVGYTLSKSDGQRQRHPRAQRRRAVPAEQQLLRVRMGAVDLRRPAPARRHRCSTSCRSGQASRSLQAGVGSAFFGGWQVSAIINKSSGFPQRPGRRHGHPQHRRADLPPEPRGWPGSQ